MLPPCGLPKVNDVMDIFSAHCSIACLRNIQGYLSSGLGKSSI